MQNYNNNVAPLLQVIPKEDLVIISFLPNFPYIFFLLIQLFLKLKLFIKE